jgi:DMSO/TMAO reductase YedYZ molybdopterin-dependent catalytic subunit
MNERLARAYSKPSRLAPNFPRAAARMPRINGIIGLSDGFDTAKWTLRAETPQRTSAAMHLTLDDIKALPRVEMVTELKCIEGWSDPVHWAGARLADFAAKFRLPTRDGSPPDLRQKPEALFNYVMLKTPDSDYYVGLDIESALHPQTLLCYELNGQPLTLEHGAPLRLVIPVKYGIKNIKRIGTIRFTDQRPADYWAERGYDWYAGH